MNASSPDSSPNSTPNSVSNPILNPTPNRATIEVPLWARRLGYAGLIPFVLGAVLIWLVREDVHPYVTLALSAYAGVIVSFLGGIHWGMAMRDRAPEFKLFAWGVIASLAAWVGVVMPPDAGLILEGALLVVSYLVDRKVYPREGLSQWLTLRFRLSAVAALSCFVGGANA